METAGDPKLVRIGIMVLFESPDFFLKKTSLFFFLFLVTVVMKMHSTHHLVITRKSCSGSGVRGQDYPYGCSENLGFRSRWRATIRRRQIRQPRRRHWQLHLQRCSCKSQNQCEFLLPVRSYVYLFFDFDALSFSWISTPFSRQETHYKIDFWVCS